MLRHINCCSLPFLIAFLLGNGSSVAQTERRDDVPRIVPLRVPVDQISRWFPDQAEIKGMKAEAFDSLMDKVRLNAARRRSEETEAPRFLKSKHEIIWKQGVLEGKSTMVLDSPRPGRERVLLDPWTPAIAPNRSEPAPVVADDSGRGFLLVDFAAKKNAMVEIAWRQGSRPGSGGRRFTLGLPRTPVRELQLELPKSLKPDSASWLSRGPFASQKPENWIWVYDGASGDVVLSLVETDRPADGPADAPRFWGERTTRLELKEGAGTLRSDWSLAAKVRRPSTLRFQLSRGVEILDVTGEELIDFKVGRDPRNGEILTIRLEEASTNPAAIKKTSFQINALVNAPDEGVWSVPTIEPINGVLVKGTTLVVPGGSREIAGLRPANGRRVERESTDPSAPLAFAFDDEGTGSVATFEFRRKRADTVVEIRGELFVGNSVPRLEAYLSWKFLAGRRFNLDVDLPRAWQADRVELVGVDEPIAWHPETRPGGEIRLHVALPARDWSGGSPILKISAIANVAGGRGSLMLPRIHPVDSRIKDETWIANIDKGYRIVPTESKGLAWIEPSSWTPFTADSRSNAPSPKKPADAPAPTRQAELAWRWLTSQGEARVERQRSEESTRATINALATLTDDHIDLLARISVYSNAETANSILIGLNAAVANPRDWRISDGSTGQELPHELVDQKTRSDAKIQGEGTTWKVELPASTSNRWIVQVAHVKARGGKDMLPLILLPSAIASPSLTVVRASRNLQTEFKTDGIRALDAEVAMNKLTPELPALAQDASLFKSIKAFEYDAKTASVEILSRPLAQSGGGGVVERLRISTTIDPAGPARHRFLLDVIPGEAGSVSVEIPDGVELVELRREGLPFVPQRQGSKLVIPLAASSSTMKPRIPILLEVETAQSVGGYSRQVAPPRLNFSLACLATYWRVTVSEDWRLTGASPDLVDSDPSESSKGGLRQLANEIRILLGIRNRYKKPTAASIAGRQSVLETIFKTLEPGEWELAPILSRWNKESSSILIDRFAVDDLGIVPQTIIRVENEVSDRTSAFLRNLRSLGLALYPVGNSLLLTSQATVADLDAARSENPDQEAVWQQRINDVLNTGNDASDRFQTIADWREQSATCPEGAATPTNPRGDSRNLVPLNHRRSYRFTARGWPEFGMHVRFEDRERERSWLLGGIPAGIILVIGVARSTPPHLRPFLSFATLLLTFNGFWLLPTAPRLIALVLFAFVSLLILKDLASRLRSRSRREDADFILGSRQANSATTLTVRSIAVVLALGFAASLTGASLETTDAILVLYPYEAPPDPTAKPTRVLMRLADFDRLDALANREPTLPATPTDARSMVHRLRQISPDEVEVSTEIELLVAADRPTPWKFPIGESRKISATSDGKSIPVTIESGGKTGELRFESTSGPEAKKTRVVSCVIKRSLIGVVCETGLMISLPVNPHPKARIEWSSEGTDWAPTIAKAIATETLPSTKERSALLGAAPAIEVRWGGRKAGGSHPPESTVESLYLWDTTPSGDRLRSQLLIKQPGGADRLRLKLSRGVLVRDFSIPGDVDASLIDAAGGSIWEARIDPPLPEGTTIAIEFWRPKELPDGKAASPPNAPLSAPFVDVVGVEKATAVLGFRRPPDWTGRLAPSLGAEALNEETFSRNWGALPDENLTLAGALKLGVVDGRLAWPSVDCRPERPRLKVEPTLKLVARNGRVDFNLEASLIDARATSHEVQLDFPIPLQFTQVTVDGLTSWTSAEDRSLLIRFDGPALPKRRLEIAGWFAVDAEQPGLNPRFSESTIPWPKWPGQSVGAGALTVAATSKCELQNSPGAVLVSKDPESPGTAAGSVNKLTYRIVDSTLLGALRWETEPPKVSVHVLSHLTINPDTATWASRLVYNVSGGPLELIHLKLPTTWGRSATLQLQGMSHQKVSESRGETTFWTIRPEKPAWGSVVLTIRASLPLISTEPIGFPDIGPLGRGEVDTYLELTNATRNHPSIEGSSGLKPVASIGADLADDFAPEPPNPSGTTYYHVTKPGWNLRVSPSGFNATAGSTASDHAEIEMVLSPDGGILGRSVVRIDGFREAFIPWTVTADDEILAASVNGKPALTYVSDNGERLVPSERGLDQVVTLVWRSRKRPLDLARSRVIIPPRIPGRDIPTIARVFAPEGSGLLDPSGSLAATSNDAVDLTAASWIQGELRRSVDSIDRGSRSDTARLIEGIRRFESKVNEVKRRSSTPESSSRNRETTILESATRLKRELSETLAGYSLEEFQVAANDLTRSASSTALPQEATATTFPSAPCIQRIGKPFAFSGVLRGDASPVAMVWTFEPPRSSSPALPYFGLGLATVVALVGFWFFPRIRKRAA